MKNIFTKTLMALTILASSTRVHAQSTSTAGKSDYSGFTTKFSMPVGFGLSRTQGINTLHVMAEIKNDIWVGFGIGLIDKFSTAFYNGTARMNLDTKVNYALFAEVQAGFLKMAAAKGFMGSALFGFEYSLARQLRMSFAYGLQFGAGSAVPVKFATTNSDFVGNFGLHWYL